MLCRCCGWRGEGRKNQEGGTSRVAGFFFSLTLFLLVPHLTYPFFPFRRASQSLTFFFSSFPRGNRLPHTAKARRRDAPVPFFFPSLPPPTFSPFYPLHPIHLFDDKRIGRGAHQFPCRFLEPSTFQPFEATSHLHLSSFILSSREKDSALCERGADSSTPLRPTSTLHIPPDTEISKSSLSHRRQDGQVSQDKNNIDNTCFYIMTLSSIIIIIITIFMEQCLHTLPHRCSKALLLSDRLYPAPHLTSL